MPPVYRASTTMLVLVAQDARTNDYNTLVAGQQLALTYSQMLEDQLILQAVISKLGLEQTPTPWGKKSPQNP